jgi:putative endonuclease
VTRTKRDRQRAYRRGRIAEWLAEGLLRTKGFSVLARRFRSARGEIDLIAKRGNLVVLVEVKARASRADAAHAIGPRQQRRIVHAALDWLAGNAEFHDCDMRFDAILVGTAGRLTHITAAFDATGLVE